MNRIKPFLIIAIIVAIIVIVFGSLAQKEQMITVATGNFKQQPLPLKLHHLQDPQCTMIVENKKYSAQVTAKDGKTWFFDDIGCLVLWTENKNFDIPPLYWVHTIDSDKWIDAKEAFYSRDEATPMHYGFGAHEYNKGNYVTFKEMRLKMLRGENLTNPKIRKKLLGI